MSDGQITITFDCQKCWGTVIELPDDPTDDSIAKCRSCGQEFGRYGDVKAKAREVALAKLQSDLRGAFKGLKGWKVK